MKEDLTKQLNALQETVPALRGRFNIEEKKKYLSELEIELASPDLWKNRGLAEQKNKEAGQLRDFINRFNDAEKELIDAETAIAQISMGSKNLEEKAEKIIESVKNKTRKMEIEQLLSGKYDRQSATISIYAGAGGQDAEDWVSMLYEMYRKYCEKRGWKTKVLDETLGDFQSKTGRHPLKNVAFETKGDYV